MKKIIFLYDNIELPNKRIQKIIGNKSYADIILKKKTVYSRYLEALEKEKIINRIVRLDNIEDRENFIDKIANITEELNIVLLSSKFVLIDSEEFKHLINKAPYITEKIIVESGTGIAMAMYNNVHDYIKDIESKMKLENCSKIHTDSILNIGDYNNFLKYISGGFDARYFNSLKTDENIVIKSSQDKTKIKKEYVYYTLLPEDMKKWMVAPYNYEETEEEASYTMERLYVPDIAIRWVHGAITEKELRNILGKTFYYINSRKSKQISQEEYLKEANALYIDKLEKRIKDLKQCEEYATIANYIKVGTNYNSIDEIVEEYKEIYYRVISKEKKFNSVIGHGDLCFSNMLYDDDINLLKLIDPKGALVEEELWTNPNYDIAKLSHSICGRYDFFNSGAYEIMLDNNLKFKLEIKSDNEKYIEIFKEYLGKNNIDYNAIRTYEASLFLSMLPLHMDYPKKVFGFILNAINIIAELKGMIKK